MGQPTVYFAGSLEGARRLAKPGERALFASPNSAAALTDALKRGLTVIVRPGPGSARWNLALRRFLLPPAPPILQAAIGGISGAPTELPSGKASPAARREPVRANWMPGRLTDRRALALLADKPMPRLWILEDFRQLRVSDRVLSRLIRSGVKLAVCRPLSWKRARASA